MKSGLPPWLLNTYAILMQHFGFLPFEVRVAKQVLPESELTSIALFRLKERGWVRVFKKRQYRLVHPVVAIQSSINRWPSLIKDELRLPVCELAVAKLIEELGPDLKSLLLFGSLARNKTTRESDIDIFVVSSGLPEEYFRRVRLLNSIIYTHHLEAWLNLLWQKEHIYPLIDVLSITPQELDVEQPFFLDLAEVSIAIIDKGEFVKSKLNELKMKLYQRGARKITLPDDSYYWLLPKSA
ncbi:MAG: nucleotidyltransferase domain-containing protein [Conexivisphaerales archaeon]